MKNDQQREICAYSLLIAYKTRNMFHSTRYDIEHDIALSPRESIDLLSIIVGIKQKNVINSLSLSSLSLSIDINRTTLNSQSATSSLSLSSLNDLKMDIVTMMSVLQMSFNYQSERCAFILLTQSTEPCSFLFDKNEIVSLEISNI
jgi:hypothetical protein